MKSYNRLINVIKSHIFTSLPPYYEKCHPTIFLNYVKERNTDNYLYEVALFGFYESLGEEYGIPYTFKNYVSALDFFTDTLIKVMEIVDRKC